MKETSVFVLCVLITLILNVAIDVFYWDYCRPTNVKQIIYRIFSMNSTMCIYLNDAYFFTSQIILKSIYVFAIYALSYIKCLVPISKYYKSHSNGIESF